MAENDCQTSALRPNLIFRAIKLCVAFGLLAWLVFSGRIDFELLHTARGSASRYVIAFGLLLAGSLIQIYRWKRLAEFQGIPLSFTEACRMTWSSQFCALFLPGAAGGELVRGCLIAIRAPLKRMTAVATVLIDRGFGLYTLLWCGTLSGVYVLSVFQEPAKPVYAITIVSGILLCSIHVIWQFASHRRTLDIARKLLPERYFKPVSDAVASIHLETDQIVRVIILSFVSNCLSILAFFMIGRTAAPEAGVWVYFILCPMIFISTIIPVSPGGIGVGETAASLLFHTFHIENGAIMMLTFRVMNLVLRLPGALFLVMDKERTPHR